jgi:hypothetical protein
MELSELVARERIRDTLAHYNWSGDAGRLTELADAFTDDGILEVRGGDRLEGRDAILVFLGGTVSSADAARRAETTAPRRRIVRHMLTNVRFLEVAATHARVEAYYAVVTEVGLDHYGRYRDRFVPVGDRWLIAHRLVGTDWAAEGSVMADPQALG